MVLALAGRPDGACLEGPFVPLGLYAIGSAGSDHNSTSSNLLTSIAWMLAPVQTSAAVSLRAGARLWSPTRQGQEIQKQRPGWLQQPRGAGFHI